MIEKLQQIGLSEKESHIYLALAKTGESTANTIAKRTNSNRTATYNILQQLSEKSLVTYINKEKKRYYSISKPDSLLSEIKEKESIAKDLIKEINKININPITEKRIEIFEGSDGIRFVHDELRKTKDFRAINATGFIYEFLPFSGKHIVKEISQSPNAKIIATQSAKKTPLAKFKKFKIKYLPEEAENCATTFIFDDKVVIQVLKGPNPFAIKIASKEIYEGYKKDFDVLWEKL
jgi:sugar-specific transcriptional regulator TrmB